LSQLYTLALPWLKSVLPYAGKYLYPTAIVAETGTVYLTVLVTINRYLGARKLHYGRRTCSKLCAWSAHDIDRLGDRRECGQQARPSTSYMLTTQSTCRGEIPDAGGDHQPLFGGVPSVRPAAQIN